MALDYDLELDTQLEPIEALHLLADKLDFEWCADNRLQGSGVIIGSLSTSNTSELSQSVFEEAYGFRPSIIVWFRLDKFDDHDEGYRNMMRAITLLLGQSDGDAVLVFNGEITVLQRIGGELALNNEWNPSPPDEVTLPYQMRPLASPLL